MEGDFPNDCILPLTFLALPSGSSKLKHMLKARAWVVN